MNPLNHKKNNIYADGVILSSKRERPMMNTKNKKKANTNIKGSLNNAIWLKV